MSPFEYMPGAVISPRDSQPKYSRQFLYETVMPSNLLSSVSPAAAKRIDFLPLSVRGASFA